MTQKELTDLNIGQNLDNLANLDPRGYGVCRILYKAAREYTGEPMTMHAAKLLCDTLKEGDLVYLMTGFVLIDNKSAETDGIVSTMLLARALVMAFGVKPVVICQEENMEAVKNLSRVVGLHLYSTFDELFANPVSIAAFAFTKDKEKAESQADELLSHGMPKALIANEFPGENRVGEFHNAVGKNTTPLEAKADILFEKIQAAGVLNIAIGDLGNEIGMGAIGAHLDKYIPYAAKGACSCGCGGGLATRVAADNIITATVSDWGCYGMIAAIAYLLGDMDIMHDAELEKEALCTAAKSGMVDMYGWTIPAIDGFDLQTNMAIVTMMRECIRYAPKLKIKCKTWFDKTLELKFFEENK